jgi:KDO2-lipid IV(A) lauroyltransferase
LTQYQWLKLSAPVVGRLPSVFYPASALAGTIGWHSRRHSRRNLVRNMLPLCGGDQQQATVEAKRAYRNIGRYWVDLTTMPHRDYATFERDHVRYVDEDRLDVLRGRDPVIIVGAHTGGAELILQAMSGRGRRFTALVEDVQPPELGDYMNRMRSVAGGCFRPASLGGVRAALEALRRGEVVGIMGDRDLQGTGVCVSLAGRGVRLPRGPWELARRTGAVVLPMFAARDWRDRFEVRVEEPFRVECGPDETVAVSDAARRFATLLEAHLLREPGQWTIVEDFWRVHACGEG